MTIITTKLIYGTIQPCVIFRHCVDRRVDAASTVSYEVDNDDKGSEKNSDITELLLLSAETLKRLKAIQSRPIQPLPAAVTTETKAETGAEQPAATEVAD
ncbi:MAG: hypothetical protein JXR76_15000 [Deltaproteobacteria bacterium]|nr:hypothetical protein [Deltaproteobacteria bacterium]